MVFVSLIAELINVHRERYFTTTTNSQKKAITEEIVGSVSGRFLKKADRKLGWVLVAGEPVRVKVAQALQYRQRRSTVEVPVAKRRRNEPVSTLTQPIGNSSACIYQKGCICGDSSSAEEPSLYEPLSPAQPTCASPVIFSNTPHPCDQEQLVTTYPLREPESRLVSDDDLLWALGYPRRSSQSRRRVAAQARSFDDNSTGVATLVVTEDIAKTTCPQGSCCSFEYQLLDPRYHSIDNAYTQPDPRCRELAAEGPPAAAEIDIYSALDGAGYLHDFF